MKNYAFTIMLSFIVLVSGGFVYAQLPEENTVQEVETPEIFSIDIQESKQIFKGDQKQLEARISFIRSQIQKLQNQLNQLENGQKTVHN